MVSTSSLNYPVCRLKALWSPSRGSPSPISLPLSFLLTAPQSVPDVFFNPNKVPEFSVSQGFKYHCLLIALYLFCENGRFRQFGHTGFLCPLTHYLKHVLLRSQWALTDHAPLIVFCGSIVSSLLCLSLLNSPVSRMLKWQQAGFPLLSLVAAPQMFKQLFQSTSHHRVKMPVRHVLLRSSLCTCQ